jgi:hypothetical protein
MNPVAPYARWTALDLAHRSLDRYQQGSIEAESLGSVPDRG